MNNINFDLPRKNLVLSFEADAVLLRYFQTQFEQAGIPSDQIKDYMNRCVNRQHFIIMASDERIDLKTETFGETHTFIEDTEFKVD